VPKVEYYGSMLAETHAIASERRRGTGCSVAFARGGRCVRGVRRRNPRTYGFSLVELLVVIAIIGILVAIVVPVALGARRSAARMREASALRSVAAAWVAYAAGQGGWVLPGYKAGFEARDENGDTIPPNVYGGSVEVQRRYPWRLAPYLDQDFRRLYVGEGAETLAKLQAGDRSQYIYFASLYPSFGLNSVFVGGDDVYLPSISNDPLLPNGQRNPARYCVTRLSAATRPQQTIVFASSRTGPVTDPYGAPDTIREGGFRVLPPWIAGSTAKWQAEYDPEDPSSFGLVSARHGDEVATATIDGGVELVQVDALRDMTRWCDGAPEREWWIGK
jgi:prepilin-type N-terminal cleavage/methylation domain-containing protein